MTTFVTAFVLSAMVCAAGREPTQDRFRDLAQAREALGTTALQTVVVEFEYRAAIAGSVTGKGESRYGGRGRLLYERPGKIRFERVGNDFPVGPVLNAWVDTPAGLVVWSAIEGRPARQAAQPADPALRRKGRQRDVVVLFVALLLADTDFLTYTPKDGQPGYVARSDQGNEADILLSDGRVQEVRYEHGVFGAVGGPPGSAAAGTPSRTQTARVVVSDFRKVGAGMLPHRLRSEYEQGWEELTIKRYVLNAPITAKEFQPPAGLTGK